jgi:hypothetical protein
MKSGSRFAVRALWSVSDAVAPPMWASRPDAIRARSDYRGKRVFQYRPFRIGRNRIGVRNAHCGFDAHHPL